MAEVATDSAPNGRTLEEDAKVEGSVNATVPAAGADEKAEKALGDAKACTTAKVGKEKADADKRADSAGKNGSTTIASVEAVSKESSDHRKGDAEPMEEDAKAGSEVTSGNKNAEQSEAGRNETIASMVTKNAEAKGTKGKDRVAASDAKANSNSSNQKVAAVEEENAEAMDIDDKKKEKLEAGSTGAAEPKPEQQKHIDAVASPKKKLGRPKKNRDADPTKEEPKTPASETKKRPRQKREPITPLSERDRPSRERKSIERFVASVEKGKKELVIKQGTGTPLMDIPNVAFKLSKRAKGDEILNMLHSLLYNKRAKANVIKYNIFRFSGYVWTENEEKERSKVKEKLERYTKEGLGQLIDVLDLHLNRTGKKEELVAKVLEFLESPHKTTDVSLEEREQKMKEKKRKSRGPGRGRGMGKRRKLEESSPTKKRGRRKKNESDEETPGEYANSDDESLEEEEEVERKRLTFVDEHDDDDDDDKDEDYEAKQKPHKRASKSSKQEAKEAVEEKVSNDEGESDGDQGTKRSGSKSSSVKSPKAPSPDITRSSSKPAEKVYTKGSRKKSKELKEKEKMKEKPAPKRVGKQKAISKEKTPKSTGRGRRGKAKESPVKKKKTSEIPSDEVLQSEIRDLLKDLSQEDFSRVTYMDIVLQLEDKFNVDLSVRKAHVKLLIRQELGRLAEEVDEEEDDQEAPPEETAEPGGDEELAEAGEEATEGTGKAETPESGAAEVDAAAGDSDAHEATEDDEAKVEGSHRATVEESKDAKVKENQPQTAKKEKKAKE